MTAAPFLGFTQIAGSHVGEGAPPPVNIGATDIFQEFHLPPLHDGIGDPVGAISIHLQVGARAQRLNITSHSPIDAWVAAQALIAQDPSRNPSAARVTMPPVASIAFSGTTASALNQLLAKSTTFSVQVTSSALSIDQPVEIRRSGIVLNLGNAQISSANPNPYAVRIENTSNVTVSGGNFIGGNSAILVNASSGVTVTGAHITSLAGDGIVVTGSNHVIVDDNQISGVGMAGIVIHRGTTSSLVENNAVTGDTGTQNAAGGILITDREVDLASNPAAIFAPGGYGFVVESMLQRQNPPHDNLIAFNKLTRNNSSGIYVDGAVKNVIVSNTVQGNAKEGMCLDDGATANVVALNIFEQNGDRWGESNVVMSDEFILGGGRIADGTPAEKVPGISMDNALYNVVFANTIAHNYGGGVKMVRTGYFNSIGGNLLIDNNDGGSAGQHFFGVEMGSAPGDASSIELDFTPSHGNLVFSNMIRGNHFSGIFLDSGSDQNQVFNNVIFDAQNWALESVSQMQNTSLNNLTSLPSRNIGSGLDPALITSGQPVNDPPPTTTTP